ncbi:FAD binding domain-containing protein [Arthrobacter ramosus]|uniref:FAD binding domain-containing protein n=1 Tax=Arthrobacter ramosus TaxID=1672 RepID=A0ABV5Y591_ARTRM|nr:FAD binding domain-containing protein [Arthrobacter ramosus]
MSEPRFSEPSDFDEACRLLLRPDDNVVALAGGTWIMRSRLRKESIADHIVSLGMIPELQRVNSTDDGSLWVGSMVTHTQLAIATAGLQGFANLHTAAAKSANPNVRNVATVGGNVCSNGFSAADLVPALLSLDAKVFFTDADGAQQEPIAQFMHRPAANSLLVRGLKVPAQTGVGAHIRLTLRAAGDYSVAIVSGTLNLDDGVVSQAAISLGSVEAVARRWGSLETAITGQPLDARQAEDFAKDLLHELVPRESIGTPAQYRLVVTPSLVRRFIEAVQAAAPTYRSEAVAS